MLDVFLKAIVDSDNCNIVVCDLNHTIIYMNKKALLDYSKHGNLIGKSIFDCHNEASKEAIVKVVEWFKNDKNNNRCHTFYNEKKNKDVYMMALRDNDTLIGYYEKHEFREKDNSPCYDLK